MSNRVAAIQSSTDPTIWHYIPGTNNPDDVASRGTTPSALITHNLWWNGRKWLGFLSSQWPENKFPVIQEKIFLK